MVDHGDDAMRRVATARRIGIVGGVMTCVLLTLTSASAHTYRPHRPAVTAVDARTGEQLPANPLLQPGSRVILTVPGFASRTHVVVALVGVRQLGSLRADRRGAVVYLYTVPGRLGRGQHTLIFSGPAPPAGSPASHPTRSRPRRARAPFVVTVPYDPNWPFRTGRPAQHGTGGEHQHRPGDQHGTQGSSAGPPSATGINLVPLLIIGPAAIILGGLVLAAGRCRGTRTPASR